jgi:predicted TIM-barrel fold metal-dependent hydrolase
MQKGKSMRRTRIAVFVATLIGITALTATYSRSQTPPAKKQRKSAPVAATGWQTNPEWMKTKYGDWGGPGVDPRPGAMDTILLKDWAPKSSIKVQETSVPKAKYPVIDVHAHVVAKTPAEVAAWVKTMDEVGVEMTVVLTGATGAEFDKLVELYLKPYPTRFQLWCGVETKDFDKPDYPQRAAAELARCYKKGARGTGELSDKGWGWGAPGAPRDKRLHPDDPRLDAFWNKAAELKIPANIHVADHPSCWTPLDVFQERTPDYQHFSQFGKDVPSYQELLDIRDRTLARHPKMTFVACHLGNQGNDLTALSKELDKYPNLILDISARDYEVGRTPRAAVKFLTKYRSRVMFGTDMGREASMYRAWWRLFETADENMPGRVWWRYYGLELQPQALEALYRGNAKKILNWVK